MRLVVVVLLAGCWRAGDVAPSAPTTRLGPPSPSMIERVHGLAELQHETAALDAPLQAALQRILGLSNETERLAIREQLRELAASIERLRARARVARTRGDDAAAVDEVERQLAEVAVALTKLRHGLRYANSLEELQAFRPVEPAPRDDDRVDVVLSPGPVHWRAGTWISP